MYIFYERIKYDYVAFSSSARKHVPRVSLFPPSRHLSLSHVLAPSRSCTATTPIRFFRILNFNFRVQSVWILKRSTGNNSRRKLRADSRLKRYIGRRRGRRTRRRRRNSTDSTVRSRSKPRRRCTVHLRGPPPIETSVSRINVDFCRLN